MHFYPVDGRMPKTLKTKGLGIERVQAGTEKEQFFGYGRKSPPEALISLRPIIPERDWDKLIPTSWITDTGCNKGQ